MMASWTSRVNTYDTEYITSEENQQMESVEWEISPTKQQWKKF